MGVARFDALLSGVADRNEMPHCDRENLNSALGQNPIAIQYMNFFHTAIGCDHSFHADCVSEIGVGHPRIDHMALYGASVTCK
jgi:hypothetical protein